MNAWRMDMKINFLVGSLILREKKTGVHLYYDNIIQKYITDSQCSDELNLSVYETYSSLRERYPDEIPYERYLNTSFRLARFFTYFLPIELFFGRSDIYICDGLSPKTLFKSKRVFVIHDLMVYLYPQNYTFLMKTYLKSFFERAAREADHVIAVSKTTKRDIVQILGVPEERVSVVYNGVERFAGQDDIREDISCAAEKKYLFYIGDFRDNKNVISAIQAFEKYMRRDPELHFFLAGNPRGKNYIKIREYIKERGISSKIAFLGYVSDAEKVFLYRHAHAFVFVSLYEGFGVPIVEAMLYETPVITSNCSSMAEIAVDGSAILVDPTNIGEIASAMEAVDDLTCRRHLVEKGKSIAERYTWDAAYHDFCNVVGQIS